MAAAVAAGPVAASAADADPVVVSGDASAAGVAGAEFALSLSDASGWVRAAVALAVAAAVAFAAAAAFVAATACLLPRAAPAFAIAVSPALGLVTAALFAGLPPAFPPVLLPAVSELA